MENQYKSVMQILPTKIRKAVNFDEIDFKNLIEIRMRIKKPLIILIGNNNYYVDEDGSLNCDTKNYLVIEKTDVNELIEYISRYSIYAFEEEMRQGYVTIEGGHRVGITGKIVMEGHRIKTMKNVSCVNIRVSHQVKGCADRIIPYLFDDNNRIMHTLIISPPRCGKTTLLRDIIRQISDGDEVRDGVTVGVVDERSEIGACYHGVPQNDIGLRTDILDCCPKSEGMMMLIRAMAPEIIAVDEIGGREDIDAIEYIINCGCRLLATVHGNSISDVLSKPILGQLVRNRVFDRYIILNNGKRPGIIDCIFDSRGSVLWEGK